LINTSDEVIEVTVEDGYNFFISEIILLTRYAEYAIERMPYGIYKDFPVSDKETICRLKRLCNKADVIHLAMAIHQNDISDKEYIQAELKLKNIEFDINIRFGALIDEIKAYFLKDGRIVSSVTAGTLPRNILSLRDVEVESSVIDCEIVA